MALPERNQKILDQGLRIGTHETGGKQLIAGLGNALDSGATAIQLFAGNPQRYWAGKVAPEATDLWNEQSAGLYKIVHSVYILNACEDPATRSARMSKHSIRNQLEWAAKHTCDAFVFHPGSPKDYDRADSRQWMRQAVAEAIHEADVPSVRCCLENAAISRDKWGKSKYTGDIDELIEDVNIIVNDFHVDKDLIGIVIDTTHCYASGYTVQMMVEAMKKVENSGLLECIHFNTPDSHVKLNGGVRHDRHSSTFDQGKFSTAELQTIFQAFRHLPLILEGTPYLPADLVHLLRWEQSIRDGKPFPKLSSDLGPLFDTDVASDNDSSKLP